VRPRRALVAFVVTSVFAVCAWASGADVVDVKVRRSAPSTYDFDVTVKSVDRGTSYYADGIEVLAPDGKLLGRRELLHAHEDEQPFTRDVYGVRIPAGIDSVVVRAHHSVKGYDGRTVTVKVPTR
jgi:hypothetical protein